MSDKDIVQMDVELFDLLYSLRINLRKAAMSLKQGGEGYSPPISSMSMSDE